MKPILLYDENETTFTSNGLGSLNEAISAIVTEERNGTYELVLTYPVSGKHFADIGYSCIIKCATVPGGEYQLFRIYAISKERNGVVTINAEHISYQLSYIPVDGFTATSVVEALYKMGTEAMTPCPFTFWTDKETVARYHQEVPENIRARLGGTSGSILDVYGGEYEWDNYTVKLHNHRGQNRNVTLRYGKNITDISQEENISNVYTSIVGYYQDDTTVVKTSVIDSTYASAYPFKRVKIVDFSADYEEAPTVQQLTTKATAYMNNNDFGIPHVNIRVSFVALWQTEEYKDVAPLERVYLCDTVSVNFEKLGIITSAKVVKTQYNVLLDKYDSIDLGEARTNLSERLANQENEIQQQIVETKTDMEKAVNHATELLRGGLGGHVVLNTDANGKPQEILIMDSEDIATAEKVWRWNLNGFGYSSHGYDPEPPYGYGTAITMDGAIVADFITTGTMTANRVRAGLLTDELGYNYWNLSTGEFRLSQGVKGKTQTFTSQPTPPYHVGDVWFKGSNGDILTCITERLTGSYTASDWSKENKYIDSSAASTAASNAVTAYDTSLNQLKVFNKLTNNGTAQGIYMDDGDLYINASYIATGILADPDGNTSWNLRTGALTSKKLSVQSTNFILTEAGLITATGATLNRATIQSGTSGSQTQVYIDDGEIDFGADSTNPDARIKYTNTQISDDPARYVDNLEINSDDGIFITNNHDNGIEIIYNQYSDYLIIHEGDRNDSNAGPLSYIYLDRDGYGNFGQIFLGAGERNGSWDESAIGIAQSIDINAYNSLNLSSQNDEISLSAGDARIHVNELNQNNIEIGSFGGNIIIASAIGFGGSVSIEADDTISLSGSDHTEISGGDVLINGGDVSINGGATVQINSTTINYLDASDNSSPCNVIHVDYDPNTGFVTDVYIDGRIGVWY